MKNCNTCREDKSLEEFYKIKNRDGSVRLNPRCKECSKKASNISYERKIAGVDSIAIARESREAYRKAVSNGEMYYNSPRMCVNGHVGKRLTSTQQCVRCQRNRARAERSCDSARLRKHQALRRRVARQLGKTRYKSVLACKKGHNSYRLVSTSQCCECLSQRNVEKIKYPTTESSALRKNAKRRSRAGRVKARAYEKRLRKTPSHKAISFIRQSLRRVLQGQEKSGRSEDVCGYTRRELVDRIELNFEPGMTWDNYGEWHIDHTIPISRFISKGEFRPHIVNALCNLRPMWSFQNLSKGAAWPPNKR